MTTIGTYCSPRSIYDMRAYRFKPMVISHRKNLSNGPLHSSFESLVRIPCSALVGELSFIRKPTEKLSPGLLPDWKSTLSLRGGGWATLRMGGNSQKHGVLSWDMASIGIWMPYWGLSWAYTEMEVKTYFSSHSIHWIIMMTNKPIWTAMSLSKITIFRHCHCRKPPDSGVIQENIYM